MVSRTVDESERFSFEAFTRHPFFTEVNRWIVERVMCPGRRKIVDLGCGPGAVTKLILERLDDARNATVIGIDPSPSALAKARAAIHSKVVEFMQGSAEWVSRLVSSADAVVFLNAIHLVPDKALVMAEIRKVLNKGGVFAFNTTFFNGAYVEGTSGFWRRWVVRAVQVLRERGLNVQHTATAVARQFLSADEHSGVHAQVGVLVGGKELTRHRRGGVLHVEATLPQYLHRSHDPAPPETRGPLDVGAVEERRVECEHAALVQDFANLRHDQRFVRDEMDRIEEHHGVGGRHETRYPLRAPLHELDDFGVNRSPGFGERGRRRVDPDHRRVAGVVQPFQDQLRHGPGPAPQIDDLASPGAHHSLHDPAVDLGEERMARERFKREAFGFIHGATDHATSRSYSLWIASALKCTSRL